ncbi:metalloregulator ArsR/SmtB family transcription factor [Demequina sp.]|uniref:ArsR/SmtB family transcription factor n=1 Tax=Demequina sp. TaxID=2050685 RepID=UPI0025CC6EDA|nr:metalloregulator ArsR/SmtB family transcription factor [Demequina sp.]
MPTPYDDWSDVDGESDLDAMLRALADPVRRYILELLRDGQGAAGDLAASAAARFGISTARASQHLQVLARSGLVRVMHDGSWRWYGISVGAAGPVAEWMRGVELAR